MGEPIINQPKFSAARHRTIGALAQSFLTKNALKEVSRITSKINNVGLEEIATWADLIKPTVKNKPTDKDTLDFLAEYPDTREWHFVNLPLDATGYDTNLYSAFTRENDIVHSTNECIKVLTGGSKKFTELNALRWLVHLIGDMHQPLHIACGYIDYQPQIPKIIFDKDTILQNNLLQKSDKGGNNINLTASKSLHSYWDDDLPEMDKNFDNIVYKAPAAVPINQLIELPAQWTGDNLKKSKEAYKGLTVVGKNAKKPTYLDIQWDKVEYNKRCIPIIKELSITAANRLAFILNTIYP